MREQIFFFLIALALCMLNEAAVSDKRRCVDENCTVPISEGVTLVRYTAVEHGYLSFQPGEVVKIFSKEAGSNMELWGVEVRGKRGYIPKSMVKEKMVLNHNIKHVVDTEFQPAHNVPSTHSSDTIVIDGTTLRNDILPSVTQQPQHSLPSTAVPLVQEGQQTERFATGEVDIKKWENKNIKNKPENPKKAIEIEQNVINSEELAKTDDIVYTDGEMEAENEDEDEDGDDDEDEGEDGDEEDDENNYSEQKNDILLGSPEIKLESSGLSENKANIETSTENIDIASQDNPGQNVNEVQMNPAVVSLTEAPPTQSPPSTKPFLMSHNVNTSSQVTGTPSIFVQPETERTGHVDFSAQKVDAMLVTDDLNVSGEFKTGANGAINVALVTDETIATTTETIPLTMKETLMSPGSEEPLLEGRSAAVEENQIYDEIGLVYGETTKNEAFQENRADMNAINENIDEIKSVTSVPSLLESVSFTHNVFGASSKELTETPEGNVKLEETPLEETSAGAEENQIYDEFGPFYGKERKNEAIHENRADMNAINENIDEIKSVSGGSSLLESVSVTHNVFGASSKEPTVTPEGNVKSEEVTAKLVGFFDLTVAETPLLPVAKDPIPQGTIESETVNIADERKSNNNLGGMQEKAVSTQPSTWNLAGDDIRRYLLSQYASHNSHPDSCPASDDNCHTDIASSMLDSELNSHEYSNMTSVLDMFVFSDTLMIVAITGACVVLFLWGYMLIEKMRKEGPLVGKINQLEQQLLIMVKENEVLSSKLEDTKLSHQEINENVSSELVVELQRELDDAQSARFALEEQVQLLEKELENSMEVCLELNKMLSDVLSSQNGSDTVLANIEQLQKQLVEQQSIINNVNGKLNDKDTENHELQLELEINNKKVVDLQAELEKMMLSLLKAEEEKELAVNKMEEEVNELREKSAKIKASSNAEIVQLIKQLEDGKGRLGEAQRNFEVKVKEYNFLKEGLNDSDANKSLVELSTFKAEVLQLQQDNKSLVERLAHEQIIGKNFQSEVTNLNEEKRVLKKQYEAADKEKLEALTKLEVLSSYFKEKEVELQSQLAKHETLWSEKVGETTTTSERMKFMQDEIQNFKLQVASLQQEIVSQEVDLKSQISVLEKKAHENWVAARQAERRIEDSRQEAAQLRNRLTLRERSLLEEKSQHRNGLSPLDTNGMDHHINDTASSPLLFGGREHLTTSPPLLPGLPPGFPMPPPPGVGVPPFLSAFIPGMPPPAAMFPGDHRPPPVGRMSSPPLNSRYTPDSRAFSPYDRRSPSPTDDDYYDRDDRDYYNQRSRRNNGRRSGYSSGSNSNESLDRMDRTRSHSKV